MATGPQRIATGIASPTAHLSVGARDLLQVTDPAVPIQWGEASLTQSVEEDTTHPMKTSSLRWFLAVLLGSMLSGWSACGAEDPSTEERLKKLETQLEQLAKENAALKKELGWDGKKPLNLVEDKGKAGSIGLGGYIQTQFGAGNTPDPRFTLTKANDSFSVRRARLNAYGKFAENFDFMLQGEFAGLGSGMSVQLTDGFINWNRYDALNIKAGQYKTHFGYEQLLPDTATPMIERSYMNDRLTAGRQIGASVTGSVLEKRLSYAAGAFNGNNVNNGFNDSDNFMFTARIEGIPVKTKVGKQDLTWSVGVNGLMSDDASVSIGSFGFRSATNLAKADNIFVGQRTGFGADTQVTFGRFGLQAEYIVMNYQPDNGNFTASTLDDDFNSWGYAITGTYDIVPKKLQALLRWESSQTDNDVGGNDCDELVAGLNWYLKGDNLRLMANYLYGQIEDKDWESRFLARLQVAF
jgi:phosphate-selective porin